MAVKMERARESFPISLLRSTWYAFWLLVFLVKLSILAK